MESPHPAARGRPHVLLATPSYEGAVKSTYLRSLLLSLHALRDAGIAADHLTLNYDCHVDDARNAILRFFMQTACTDLVFLDADVGWLAGELVQLIEYDADVVAGVYPKKGDDQWPVFDAPGEELRAREDGLVEVIGAPTGFMRIRRHVIERLIEANKHRQFRGQGEQEGAPLYTIVFERTYEEGHRWSGDYAFCRAWRKLGGKVFVAPEMLFGHVGETEWTGVLGDFWRKRAGIYHPDLVLGLHALYDGTTDADTFNRAFIGWGNPFSAQQPLLFAAHELVREAQGPVLETGSGLSTLIMGVAAMKAGVEVHALEHDLDYFKTTAAAIQRFGITSVRLHYAPLRPYTAGFIWYELPAGLPEQFAVVLCDGPQQRFGRRGLFELLGDQIAGAHVLMDDAYSQQLPVLKAWAEANSRSVHVHDEGHRAFAVSPAPERMAAE